MNENNKKFLISSIFSEYDKFLDKKSDEILDNDYFHSNITLSRNHLIGSELLKNLIKNHDVKINFIFTIKNIIIFYIRNFYYLFLWIFYFIFSQTKLLFKFSFKRKLNNKKYILIQTYIDKKSIIDNKKFTDNYFRELYQYLDKKSEKYIILQNISEKITNFKNRLYIINKTSTSHVSHINEFNFLVFADLFKLLIFILSYPIFLFKYYKNIKINSKIDKLYKYDLIYTLSKTSFIPYVQLLLGKRLKKKFKDKEVKIISWHENQLIHRNFNRGIKSENIKIYGCQYFMKYPSCRWMYLRENDKKFNVLPDIILVPGKKYLPSISSLKYNIGTPFRYRDIYDKEKHAKQLDRISIFVMLPYEQVQSENLIDFLNSSEYLKKLKIDIKIHPDFIHRKKYFEDRINKNWKLVDTNLDFTNYNILITKGTGSIIEFIAKGFSVLLIEDNNILSLNPLDKHGKKIIWDSIEKSSDFSFIINELYENRIKKFEKIKEISNEFKSEYFKEVTENNFKSDFGLQ